MIQALGGLLRDLVQRLELLSCIRVHTMDNQVFLRVSWHLLLLLIRALNRAVIRHEHWTDLISLNRSQEGILDSDQGHLWHHTPAS